MTIARATKTNAPRETKTAQIIKLLSRKAGADLPALQKATGWQPHSVRAALSGLRKAGYTIERMANPKPDGQAIYRITGTPEPK